MQTKCKKLAGSTGCRLLEVSLHVSPFTALLWYLCQAGKIPQAMQWQLCWLGCGSSNNGVPCWIVGKMKIRVRIMHMSERSEVLVIAVGLDTLLSISRLHKKTFSFHIAPCIHWERAKGDREIYRIYFLSHAERTIRPAGEAAWRWRPRECYSMQQNNRLTKLFRRR